MQSKRMMGGLFVMQVVLLIIITACGSSNSQRPKQTDAFYEGTGDLDSIRIPLIKPYEAIYANHSSLGWIINLQNSNPYFQLQFIEQIAVENDVIMLYAPKHKRILPSNPTWHWIVIVPSQGIEAGFDNEDVFTDYIQTYNIKEPSWKEAMSVFQVYETTGCISWIPNCRYGGEYK